MRKREKLMQHKSAVGLAAAIAVAACFLSTAANGQSGIASATVTCSLEMQWRHLGSVKLVGTRGLIFPDVETVSGVYRFALRTPALGLRYVGQSNNLRRRLKEYARTGR